MAKVRHSEETLGVIARVESAAIATLRREAMRSLCVFGEKDEQELLEIARLYTRAFHGDFTFLGVVARQDEPTNEHQNHPLVNAIRQPKVGERVLVGTVKNPEYDTIDDVVRQIDSTTWLVDTSDADSVRIMYGDLGWAVLPAMPE